VAPVSSTRPARLRFQRWIAAARAGQEAVRDALLRYKAGITPITELLLAQRIWQLASTARAAAFQQAQR